MKMYRLGIWRNLTPGYCGVCQGGPGILLMPDTQTSLQTLAEKLRRQARVVVIHDEATLHIASWDINILHVQMSQLTVCTVQ